MKLYVSVDIEGVAGITAACEMDRTKSGDYRPFQRQMTDEAVAACRGGWSSGARTIVVKDAHWTGRNLDIHAFETPPGKELLIIRGWSGHPLCMVQGIDSTYDAAAFVGYHSGAGSGSNPLAHTVSRRAFEQVELNGEPASEFLLYAYAAATFGVPLVFLSGDAALCAEAERRIDGLVTVSTLRGEGDSSTSIVPSESVRLIEAGVHLALTGRRPAPMAVPRDLHFRLTFRNPSDAYAKSFYPNAKLIGDRVLIFETTDYLAMLTFLYFAAQVTSS